MRNFNYDDDDDQKRDIEKFFEIPDDEGSDLEMNENILDIAQMELQSAELNQRILFEAIKMLEKSFFWRFRRYKTKLNMVAEVYKGFVLILREE